jgi:uncharacterized protein (TIGR03435 family)
VAKGGPRLKRPEEGRCAEDIRTGKNCGDIYFIGPVGVGIYNMPIGALVGALGRSVQDKPIVDRTGLTGKYDAELKWMPDNMKPEDLAAIPEQYRPEDVSLFTAIQQQLGLKLEARKESIDVIVVDSIDQPKDTSAGGTSAPAAFDAVSIKPNKSGSDEVHLDAPSGGNFRARNVSLKMLVMRAFKMKNFAVEGGPEWMDSDRFDIAAHADQSTITEAQFKPMLQSLLAEHFRLRAHRETRQISVYNLVPLKTGTKLPEASAPCASRDHPEPDKVFCGGFTMDGSHLEGRSVAGSQLASALSEMLGRPVVDQSGFTGTVDIRLQFAPEGIARLTGGGFEKPELPAASTGDSQPTIFTALVQKLGLKLEPGKGPAEVLVIDNAVRP